MAVPSLIIDLVALAIIILCAIYYAHRGFISGIFSFFGTLIAVVVAALAANFLAPAIFNAFFRTGLEEQITALISETHINTVDQLLQNILSFLPQALINSISATLGTELDFTAPNIAALAVDQVVRPLLTPFIMIILFFVIFSLVRVLVGVIRSLAVGLSKLPAMNTMNRALGAAVGVFIAALYIYLGLCVLWAYDAINPANPVGSTYFSRSIVYTLLYRLNFFNVL